MKRPDSIMERLVSADIPIEKAAELTLRCITTGKGQTVIEVNNDSINSSRTS